MPLPRSERLPTQRRAEILVIARRQLAAHGPDAVSYIRIMKDAGISKTSAYLYFDSKSDLVAAVQDDVVSRVASVVQPWVTEATPSGLWRRVVETSEALHRHLLEHPDDLALFGNASGEAAGPAGWLDDLLHNARTLGLVRTGLPEALLYEATRAVFGAVDRWALAALRAGQDVDHDALPRLLEGLWSGGTPPRGGRNRQTGAPA
ncbi:MAG: TetR/AcrR family transcriptional regulator [Phycicoccus sp.]